MRATTNFRIYTSMILKPTRKWFAALAGILFLIPQARAGLLLNGGFDVGGPDGSSVTTLAQPFNPVPSAAADWVQYAVADNSSLTTELLPSTDPWGSGSMMHVLTTGGFSPTANFGNGFEQYFSSVNKSVLSFDLDVVSGQVTGGLALTGSEDFVDPTPFGPTGGWIHVVEVSNQPINAVAFETMTFSANGAYTGAEYYVDNVVLSSVPEPSTIVLLGISSIASALWTIKKTRRNRAEKASVLA